MGADKAATKPSEPYWLVYLALLVAGLIMLAEATHYYPATKWTAKLAAGLLFSALALFVGNGRFPGYLATLIIWLAIVVTWVV